jgi:hypothetical protein
MILLGLRITSMLLFSFHSPLLVLWPISK